MLYAVLLLCTVQGLHCLSLSDELQDGDLVYACEGHDIPLPWNLTLEPGENITDIQWLYRGRSDEMIAIYGHGVFLVTPSFSGRVHRLPTSGLVLARAAVEDSGNYSIEITTHIGDVLATYRTTASVHVATEATARTDATMVLKQQPRAVTDNQTGQHHVELTCASKGLQPPSVIWTMPSGAEVVGTDYKDGVFSLLIPNPVSGGNYSCRVPQDSPAATCLPKDDPTLDGATIVVDEVSARLSLIEIQQETLTAENKLLKDTLSAENARLKTRLEQFINGTESQRVAFHASRPTTTTLSSEQVLVPDQVVTNLGNAYNASTGHFIAPFDGVYAFLVTTGPQATQTYSANLDLVVAGSVVSSIRTTFGSSYTYYRSGYQTTGYIGTPKTGSCHAVVHLLSGEEAWVKSYSSSYMDPQVTTFSGYLLSPDHF